MRKLLIMISILGFVACGANDGSSDLSQNNQADGNSDQQSLDLAKDDLADTLSVDLAETGEPDAKSLEDQQLSDQSTEDQPPADLSQEDQSVADLSDLSPSDQQISSDTVQDTSPADQMPPDQIQDLTASDQQDSSEPDFWGGMGAPCHSSKDCTGRNGLHCVTPGSNQCGMCRKPESPCQTDEQCKDNIGGSVCDGNRKPKGCPYCNGPELECVPPCTDDDECRLNYKCDTGRCVVDNCKKDKDCPIYYRCDTTNGGGLCVRKTCQSDTECAGGYCVNGGCHGNYGHCSLPVPGAGG